MTRTGRCSADLPAAEDALDAMRRRLDATCPGDHGVTLRVVQGALVISRPAGMTAEREAELRRWMLLEQRLLDLDRVQAARHPLDPRHPRDH